MDFDGTTHAVARRLLGATLAHGDVCGRIVEVEAYHQDGDAAAHSFNGPTRRNAAMFERAGVLYVYFIYGMHHCMNVVTEAAGIGAAVLIRAVEPIAGIEIMQACRGSKIRRRDLTNGPAKVCQAFDVGPRHNGLCLRRGPIRITPGSPKPDEVVRRSPRIGISKSVELEWRYYLEPNPYVSPRRT